LELGIGNVCNVSLQTLGIGTTLRLNTCVREF